LVPQTALVEQSCASSGRPCFRLGKTKFLAEKQPHPRDILPAEPATRVARPRPARRASTGSVGHNGAPARLLGRQRTGPAELRRGGAKGVLAQKSSGRVGTPQTPRHFGDGPRREWRSTDRLTIFMLFWWVVTHASRVEGKVGAPLQRTGGRKRERAPTGKTGGLGRGIAEGGGPGPRWSRLVGTRFSPGDVSRGGEGFLRVASITYGTGSMVGS